MTKKKNHYHVVSALAECFGRDVARNAQHRAEMHRAGLEPSQQLRPQHTQQRADQAEIYIDEVEYPSEHMKDYFIKEARRVARGSRRG